MDGGIYNSASGSGATVGGGVTNIASGRYATVGGTTNPQSNLQIASGYIQLPAITGSAPSGGDCNNSTQAGRMIVRTDGTTNLYICTGATGWVGK